jgi:hypothetical protein
VTSPFARMVVPVSLAGLLWFLVAGLAPVPRPAGAAPPGPEAARQENEKTIYVGCHLSDEDLVVFTTSLAAAGRAGPVLLSTPSTQPYLKGFLAGFGAQKVIPAGCSAPERAELESSLGVKTEAELPWDHARPDGLWHALSGKAKRAVLCAPEPRPLFLQAACLAGVLKAPLCLLHGQQQESNVVRQMLADAGTREVFAVGDLAVKLGVDLRKTRVVALAGERDVAACYLEHQRKHGRIDTLVVANPADISKHPGAMSSLAPWIALQKRAALLLTNEAGDNTAAIVAQALTDERLDRVDNLILVASPEAIPPEHRPNPVPGKDAVIDMEPLTPTGSEPFSFSTGRLFHADPGMVMLTLAREQLLAHKSTPSQALVISNPAGGLPLLEAFSRHTAKELQNSGYQTTTLFGEEVQKDLVRRLLPQQDIFLWEGHHSTLTKDYGLPDWPEALQPSLVFLQSCLALCEPDAVPLLQRGAVGVIGSSTRTYSASGGACSLAFFDALLYEDRSVGGALRQAKNFLLAFTLLKEQRLGEDAKLRGASLRSAWAFTLWGDPTLQLPRQARPAGALASVRHEVHGNTIVLRQPDQAYGKITSSQYGACMLPNARLAGLVHKGETPSERQLASLCFAEIPLPNAPPGQKPMLSSRVPGDRWVFCWDARRRCGYLLVMPRPKDPADLRFHVQWERTS